MCHFDGQTCAGNILTTYAATAEKLVKLIAQQKCKEQIIAHIFVEVQTKEETWCRHEWVRKINVPRCWQIETSIL